MNLLFWKRKPALTPYAQAFDAIERHEGDKKALIKLLIAAYVPNHNLHQNPPKGKRMPKVSV